jgi:S-(hydroxymethyl)glutathione dehydrogenase / alcohol dehydrogenase
MTKTRSAVLWNIRTPWQVEEVELDQPQSTDVLVQIKAAGLCHSDEHAYTGDVVLPLPLIGGHEGAGIVEAVGPDVKGLAPGDHVAMSFIPACGRCRWCVIGQQYLCDLGAKLFDQGIMSDGRDAHHIVTGEARKPAMRFAQLGTFSEYALLSENSLVKVDNDMPFEVVALVSCGVTTGFGSMTERAGCKPGDTVAVVGVGGVGMNAIQGARVAGAKRIFAIDPVEFKREQSISFGASRAFSSMEKAIPLINEITWGQMCNRVVLSVGVVRGDMLQPALNLTSKGGTLVITGAAPANETVADIGLSRLSSYNKEIKGTIFGSLNPREAIPRLLSMYREGVLKLDELVTQRYSLDEINKGYEDMRNGKNIRGVITFD